MKKFVSIIAILLMLSLAACSNQDTPSAADNPSNTQTESNTMLDAGVWRYLPFRMVDYYGAE